MGFHHLYMNQTCPEKIDQYIRNLTSSYTDKNNEPTMVSASVIMFVLAGLFFNLNLMADMSAVLHPRYRRFLTSALSLFLPVMSYLFSEAKNAVPRQWMGPTAAASRGDLSVKAGLILAWMLLVELLRKKVDEVRMRGYSGSVMRAGRVVWLGNLVFFNIRSAGRKAVFGVLWVLCAARVVQRIAYTELGKRSYEHGKNPRLISSYMREHRQQENVRRPMVVGPLQQDELLRRCEYIVMGEAKLVEEVTADGYRLAPIDDNGNVRSPQTQSKGGVVRVREVWKLAKTDKLFTSLDAGQPKQARLKRPCLSLALFKPLRRMFQHEPAGTTDEEAPGCRDVDRSKGTAEEADKPSTSAELKRLCLSFALFKLLRRRFEHAPAASADEEARYCRALLFNDGGLAGPRDADGNVGESAAEALVQVAHDEVNFLCEYYHSVVPVALASPSFLAVNYLFVLVAVALLCLMTVVLCGNGDAGYAFRSIGNDNYVLRLGIGRLAACVFAKAVQSPSAFFSALDLAITALLFAVYLYEEIWEFFVFLFSDWFMVSLLASYASEARWCKTRPFRLAFHWLVRMRSTLNAPCLTFRQFSALNLRCPLCWLPFLPTLLLGLRVELVPKQVKKSIVDYMANHARGIGTENYAPLSNGSNALRRLSNHSDSLSWACNSDSVVEVILTWHIATSILEGEQEPHAAEAVTSRRVAISLSKYCAYLVAFHPELLPDNPDKAEAVVEGMKEELRRMLGRWGYYLSPLSKRVETIKKATTSKDKKEPRCMIGRWCSCLSRLSERGEKVREKATTSGNQKTAEVVRKGAELATKLLPEGAKREDAWAVLAAVWTELMVFVAPSSDEERIKAHEDVLVQGGEFITVLWALTTHTRISRPADTHTANSVLASTSFKDRELP